MPPKIRVADQGLLVGLLVGPLVDRALGWLLSCPVRPPASRTHLIKSGTRRGEAGGREQWRRRGMFYDQHTSTIQLRTYGVQQMWEGDGPGVRARIRIQKQQDSVEEIKSFIEFK